MPWPGWQGGVGSQLGLRGLRGLFQPIYSVIPKMGDPRLVQAESLQTMKINPVLSR